MSDPASGDHSSPLPVPKGSYTFNFEDFDEGSNPFQSKTKLGQSPPVNDPFKPRKKIANSPPRSDGFDGNEEEINPFKSKSTMARSPPRSPVFENNNDVKIADDMLLNVEKANLDANVSNGSLEDEWCDAEEGSVEQEDSSEMLDTIPKSASIDPLSTSGEFVSACDDPLNLLVHTEEGLGSPGEEDIPTGDEPAGASDMLGQDVPEQEPESVEGAADVAPVDLDPPADVMIPPKKVFDDATEVPDEEVSPEEPPQTTANTDEPDTGVQSQSSANPEEAVAASCPQELANTDEDVVPQSLMPAGTDEPVAVSPSQSPASPDDQDAVPLSPMQSFIGEKEDAVLDQAPVEKSSETSVVNDPEQEEEAGLADSEGVEEKTEKKKKVKKKEKGKKLEEVKADVEGHRDASAEKERSQSEVKEEDESTASTIPTEAPPQDSSTTSHESSSPSSSPKKKPGVKKTLKKPKSRLKPPQNFGVQNTGDDVEIFAPAMKAAYTTEPATDSPSDPPPANQLPVEEDLQSHDKEVAKQLPVVQGLKSHDKEAANQMADSLEMVHDFGAGEDGEMPECDNEGFVPASDVFSDKATWEMLDKFGGDACKESDLGRESLFVKFDPLVQGAAGPEQEKCRGPEGAEEESAAGNEDDLMSLNTPPASGKTGNRHVKKHPAARVLAEQLDGAAGETTHTNNVDNILKCSPGKSDSGLADMNQSMGDSTKEAVVQLVQGKTESVQVLKYSQTDWNKMKQDLELSFQAQLLQKEKEWSKKLGDREKKMGYVEENNRGLKQTNEEMKAIVSEFEKTISQLQAEKEKTCNASQQSLQDIVREKEQVLDDLHSVETAFSNLHQRYEKTKGVVEGFKQNEEVLKKCVSDYQAKLKKSEQKLQLLKQQAEEKLDHANVEIEKERKGHMSEMARLQAGLKKAELQISSLEKSLEQKVKENQELTAICDELISKVGVE
ncbi:transforming acidic coiled-coil-containing protein 2-like isoform X3 [Haliotis rufescens]|uniref:transforming acidic coiled-coil-containing protein 2-like isoform X3 n=1 Tax=Haliotis rufescens TaxID=6454 RepID=UPI00201FB011|nr:transforming acidic coiled-coil-containing protein 2-like isoform X3 [Haliotis rufescens]